MHSFLTKNKKKLLSVTQAAVILALFAPLVVAPSHLIFPFVTGKVWFFQTVVAVALGGYVLLAGSDARYRPKWNTLLTVVGLYSAAFLVSTFLSIDVHRSFWSNHERLIGFFTVSHYVVFYGILTQLFRTKKQWQKFWLFFVLVAGLVSLAGVIQNWRPDFLYGGIRAASTLGNPIYLGLFAVHGFFMATYLLLQNRWGAEDGVSLSTYQRLLLLGAGVVFIVTFAFAQTRGVFLGSMAAIVWVLALVAVASDKKAVRRASLSLFLALSIIAGTLMVVVGNDAPALKDAPVLGRFTDISPNSRSNANRLYAWSVAWEGFKDRPVFGSGPFTFAYIFNKEYDGNRLVNNGFGETWFDNAHNFFLEILATRGAVGFLTYVALLVVSIVLLIRAWKKAQLPLWEVALLSGVLVMHAVQNMFAFEQTTSYIALFSILAFITFRLFPRDDTQSVSQSQSASSAMVLSGVVVIAVGLLLYHGNYKPYKGNRLMFDAISQLTDHNNPTAWFEGHRAALEVGSPYSNHISEELARFLLKVQVPVEQRNKDLESVLRYSIDAIEQSSLNHPNHLIYKMLLGELWYRAALDFPNAFPSGQVLGDSALKEAIELSPERQQLYILRAGYKHRTGQYLEGRDALALARSFAPSAFEVLQSYADYLDSISLEPHRAAATRYWVAKIAPFKMSLQQHDALALKLAEFGGVKKAQEVLRASMACQAVILDDPRYQTDLPCFTDTPHAMIGLPYQPSAEAFLGVISYYKDLKDEDAIARWQTLFEELYQANSLDDRA